MNVTVTTPSGTSATSASDDYTYNPAPTVTGVSPTSGPRGGTNTVTVSGTGFTGATAVDFGTKAGTSIVVAAGGASLTVTRPRAPAP